MRLIKADILKLRRRRGMMIWSALLTVGVPVVAYTVLLALHASSPDAHGAAGGRANLENLLGVIATLGVLAGILIGTSAGSQDASSGVFRDLVVTGRPRKALFEARFPAALAVYLPLLAATFGLAVAGCFAFAGPAVTPDAGHVARYGAWIFASGVVNTALGVGVAALVGSRIAVGVLVAWNVALAPLLLQVQALGGARAAIDVAAAQSFVPSTLGGDTAPVAMSAATAVAVLVAWTFVALRAGRMRTVRRDA